MKRRISLVVVLSLSLIAQAAVQSAYAYSAQSTQSIHEEERAALAALREHEAVVASGAYDKALADLESKQSKGEKITGPACEALYLKAIKRRMEHRHNLKKTLSKVAVGGAAASVGTWMVAGLTGNFPLMIGSGIAYLVNHGTYTYTTEHRDHAPRLAALRQLHAQSSREYVKFSQKIRKKVPSATNQQINQVIEDGFADGTFCEGGKVKSVGKIQRHVVEKLRANPTPVTPIGTYKSVKSSRPARSANSAM